VEKVLDPEAVADVYQVRVLWVTFLGSCVCSMVVISAVVVWLREEVGMVSIIPVGLCAEFMD
jgi:predicted anti-sigma-YlaC factor YlaD